MLREKSYSDDTRWRLLKLLARGKPLSSTELAHRFAIAPGAIDACIVELRQRGLEIVYSADSGYRLIDPISLIDSARLRAQLERLSPDWHGRLLVFEQLPSTNDYLREIAEMNTGHENVCICELQTQGRGRYGRGWIASPYRNLILSLLWRFPGPPSALAGLSLAVGVAVTQALEALSFTGVMLKWPNDLWHQQKKFGGILVDLIPNSGDGTAAVIGIGINVQLTPKDAEQITQPWTELSHMTEVLIERNQLAAHVVAQLVQMCRSFVQQGFAAYRETWQARHALQGASVEIHRGQEVSIGTVAGIDDHGALSVRDDRGILRLFTSGEVTVRPLA